MLRTKRKGCKRLVELAKMLQKTTTMEIRNITKIMMMITLICSCRNKN